MPTYFISYLKKVILYLIINNIILTDNSLEKNVLLPLKSIL